MADTPKHFVGFPTDHDLTEEEAEQFGLMLFDSINAERANQDQPQTPDDSKADEPSATE